MLILPPRNLHDHEPYKIRQDPVATMRAQHVEVLDVKRATAARDCPVDLPVIVEQVHALLGDFLAREVVGFQLDG